MKEKVVIGRKWNNPQIYTSVVHTPDGKIEMQISIQDFINALVEEMGSPALTMTKSGLKAKLIEASNAVLTEVKTASREIV